MLRIKGHLMIIIGTQLHVIPTRAFTRTCLLNRNPTYC